MKVQISNIWAAGMRFARQPAFFALGFQGVNGLVQLSGFFRLKGQAYLDFSGAYMVGNVAGLFLLLNYENMILAGKFSRSIRRYVLTAWMIGIGAAAFAVIQGAPSPSLVAFAGWTICVRILLAWANSNRPNPFLLGSAIVLVGASVLLATPSQVMLACFLSLPIAAPGLFFGAISSDEGVITTIRRSGKAFLSYIPHTLSGIALTYLDRFLALSVVRGDSAEFYLRTVQVCSWAAFIAFPVVFHLRSAMLKSGVLSPRRALAILSVQGLAMLITTTAVYIVLWRLGRLHNLALLPLVTVFTAIVLSQYYQIVSSLNFVLERFGVINRVTLTSAGVAAIGGIAGVLVYPRVETLALMLLAGWLVQALLTTRSLMSLRPAPAPASTP